MRLPRALGGASPRRRRTATQNDDELDYCFLSYRVTGPRLSSNISRYHDNGFSAIPWNKIVNHLLVLVASCASVIPSFLHERLWKGRKQYDDTTGYYGRELPRPS